MRIVAAGAVGIDNSSPDSFSGGGSTAASLVVGKGTSGVSPHITLWQGNSAQASLSFASANTGAGQYEGRIRYTRDTGVMDFRTNGVANVLVLSAAGNVGIGTNSPDEKLDVQGNILVGDYLKLGSSANYMGQLGLNRNIDTGGIYNSSYGAYQIQNYQGDLQFQIYNSSGGSVCTHEFFNNGDVFFDGDVGIGNTSPRAKGLEIFRAAGESSYPQLILSTGESNSLDYSLATDTVSPGDFCILSGVSNTSSAIKMRFQGNDVFFGTPTSTYPSTNNFVHINTQSGVSMVIGGHSGTHTSVQFRHNGATIVGSIVVTSSSTTYNTSSDYRLKEDLKDFSGLDMVSKIPVYDFKWKTDESRSYGVMAHELQEVLPQAVNGEKDLVNEDGSINPQGVDYSKIVPILIKSIQELKAKVEELENK